MEVIAISGSVRKSNQLVGINNAISDGHLVVYYPHLLVHPDYYRQGIGKRMMQALQKIFRSASTNVDG